MRRQNGVYIGELGLAISRARPTRPGRRGECTPFPVTTIDPDVNGIYAPLDVFLLRLLDDPTFRAPSAECAEAVWHPLFARRLYGNVNEVLKWRLKAALATKRALSPEGEGVDGGREGGGRSDPVAVPHIHEEHQDIGLCGSPLGVYYPGDLALTHWGDLDCHPPDTKLVVLPGGVRHSLRLVRNGSLWQPTDHELVRAARGAYAPETIHAPRSRTLFFRGASREDRAPEDVALACFRPNRTASCRDGVYSLGIRQTVKRVLGGHPMVNLSGGRLLPWLYARALREHHFCLTAPGMGFGVRIVDYVVSGCLPVVVRPGRLLLPFEPDLDYSEFAVSVDFADIAHLPSMLAGLSDEEIRRKRERLRDVHRMFVWDAAYGRAYEAVREQVQARLRLTG